MPRIGLGTDLHRLEPGNGFSLGGVFVECEYNVIAHSDGDVLLHALTDAILGALGEGDIGDRFPDNDPANKDRDSVDFLNAALELMGQRGYRFENADITLTIERPKLGKLKTQIKNNVAQLLSCPESRVNVKAKTAEKVGPVGECRAIEALVCLLLLEETHE